MKHLKLSPEIICIACLLFFSACNNSLGNKTNTPGATTSASSANTTAAYSNLTGKEGSFDYTINGERVESKNYVQHGGLFINEVSNDAANGMVTIKVTPNGKYFEFHIANTGTTSIGTYHPSFAEDPKRKEATYTDTKILGNFYSVEVTVTITSINENRVKGTFSGTYLQDNSYGNKTVKITDGSFNLPFEKN